MNKEKEIEELKSALNDAIRSFTRMETLYKLKCNELDVEKEKTKKETAKEILQDLYDEASKYCDNTMGLNTYEIKQWAKKYGVEVDE